MHVVVVVSSSVGPPLFLAFDFCGHVERRVWGSGVLCGFRLGYLRSNQHVLFAWRVSNVCFACVLQSFPSFGRAGSLGCGGCSSVDMTLTLALGSFSML
jgi:hypothetical protein